MSEGKGHWGMKKVRERRARQARLAAERAEENADAKQAAERAEDARVLNEAVESGPSETGGAPTMMFGDELHRKYALDFVNYIQSDEDFEAFIELQKEAWEIAKRNRKMGEELKAIRTIVDSGIEPEAELTPEEAEAKLQKQVAGEFLEDPVR